MKSIRRSRSWEFQASENSCSVSVVGFMERPCRIYFRFWFFHYSEPALPVCRSSCRVLIGPDFPSASRPLDQGFQVGADPGFIPISNTLTISPPHTLRGFSRPRRAVLTRRRGTDAEALRRLPGNRCGGPFSAIWTTIFRRSGSMPHEYRRLSWFADLPAAGFNESTGPHP